MVPNPSVAGSEAGGPQVVFDANATMYVTNYTNNVVGTVLHNSSTETTAGITLPSGCGPWGLAIRAKTLVIGCYVTGQLLQAVLPIPAGGESTTVIGNLGFSYPGEFATDPASNIFVANQYQWNIK